MKRSFTIIELLVVIAIIGVLFVITFRASVVGRIRARDVIRKQNLQSISLSMTMYRKDYNKYPLDDSSKAAFCSTLSNYVSQYAYWQSLNTELNPYIDPIPTDPLSKCTGTYATTIGYPNILPEYTYNVRTGTRYSFSANLENTNDSERGSLGFYDKLLYGTQNSIANPHIYMVGCVLEDASETGYRTSPCH